MKSPTSSGKGFAAAAAGLLAACSATNAAPAAGGRTRLQRDVESYAVITCLGLQDQAYLKEQSGGWASNLLQRSKGGIEDFTPIGTAVQAEIAKGGMAMVIVESPPMTELLLPVQFCTEIVDKPGVRAAIDAAAGRLAADYRRADADK